MMRMLIAMIALILVMPFGAFAVTGSGESGTIPLETVSPTLDAVVPVSERTLSATFSEPMLWPGITAPGNYAVSDVGAGTLNPSPDAVVGSGPYTLIWLEGEMRNGATVTVTATGLQDALGNPIDPAGNSASCTGLGIGPTFALSANPSQAEVDEPVTITLRVSEPLDGNPIVMINGHEATDIVPSDDTNFIITYVVQATDALGLAGVSVTGFDLAGHMGTFETLEIVDNDPEPAVPLRAWPVGTALLAAGLLVLAWRRHRAGVLLLLLMAVLVAQASLPAFAQTPAVSNVTYTQSPNGTTSTKVDITYDLVSPNGPCDITVSLSDDEGEDEFSHLVTTVTGDIAGVTPGTGKHIVWDIRADYPEESLPNARIRVTADDGAVLVEYYRDDDQDTYGQDGDFVWAVGPVAPYTATMGGDCDDTNPNINPGHPEVCGNGKDDNCDAQTDEGCVQYFRDDDGDMYGDDTDFVWAAGPVEPYTTTIVGDCDDTDPNINPGHPEVCGNGKDDNCNAIIDEGCPPVVTSFVINSGAATTTNVVVTLNNAATYSPTDYMASESDSFSGATWQSYSTAPSFTLSIGVGTRTVYFKVKNEAGESGVVNDTIFLVPETVSVGASTFTMGRPYAWDPLWGYEHTDELPTHSVSLGAYQIGKGEVTNKEYCDVLNWAKAQGYLYSDAAGTAWPGSGDIYAGGTATSRYLIVFLTSADCNIQYSGGVFSSKTRVGLPGTTNYSMDTHPMVRVSWYGSVAFCNWLSQWQGLTLCYDMVTALWPLTVAPPTSGGYRLPTEAEWERAAAWDGAKHWIYGFTSDTLTGKDRANYYDAMPFNVNPLGLTTTPYTSPDAWFDGVHVSPNGSVTTVNSVSPVGCFDMTGNVWEWCHDWYLNTYYTNGGPPWTNPAGPATGSSRVVRGGSWQNGNDNCRSAARNDINPVNVDFYLGFRIVRTP